MERIQPILVCFAVTEEARPFQLRAKHRNHIHVLLTGIGETNAGNALRTALSRFKPGLVISSGFAGGLNPEISAGSIVFDCDPVLDLSNRLAAAGARPATFQTALRIAATAVAKSKLWSEYRADAVDMESAIIRSICHTSGIPSATVRVISDTAGEDLPMDFNRVMGDHSRVRFGRLAMEILKSPGTLAPLIRFAQQTRNAAVNLARVLDHVISDQG